MNRVYLCFPITPVCTPCAMSQLVNVYCVLRAYACTGQSVACCSVRTSTAQTRINLHSPYILSTRRVLYLPVYTITKNINFHRKPIIFADRVIWRADTVIFSTSCARIHLYIYKNFTQQPLPFDIAKRCFFIIATNLVHEFWRGIRTSLWIYEIRSICPRMTHELSICRVSCPSAEDSVISNF